MTRAESDPTPASTHWEHALRAGIMRRARNGLDVHYRFIRDSDDIEAATQLLHRAYARLAQAGLRYVASHQSPAVTRQRMGRGFTIVAVVDDVVIGLITLSLTATTSGSPFYDREDVASFGQFAVEPSRQRAGIGATLLGLVEVLAAERGVGYLALDTSEQATELRRFYEVRGFQFVEFVRWPSVNYRSVILAKAEAALQRTV